MDIAEFLLARIAEDEAVALRAAEDGHPEWRCGELPDEEGDVYDKKSVHYDSEVGGRKSQVLYDEGMTSESEAEHIARHDPARVIAECDAKRRIVALYLGSRDALTRTTDPLKRLIVEAINESHGDVLKPLALPYADHPHCREEWRTQTGTMSARR